MLVSPAPIAIPVNTANVPTEALAAEAIARPKIPQPTSAAENTANRNATEFADQNKPNFDSTLRGEAGKSVNEKEQGDSERNPNENQQQSSGQRSEQELDNHQIAQIRQLQSRDREVRAHEQAHSSVGGNLAGAPSLNFTTGPDGKRYAVSGEVSIDVSAVSGDPAATIRKLEQVQRAALAPADPSSQDRRVAASASASANLARSELNVEQISNRSEAADARIEKAQETDAGSQTNAQPNSTAGNIDRVLGRRQAENLAHRLLGSGAFELDVVGNNLSINA